MSRKSILFFDGEIRFIPPIATLVRVLRDIGENPTIVLFDYGKNREDISALSLDAIFLDIEDRFVSWFRNPIRRLYKVLLKKRWFRGWQDKIWSRIESAANGEEFLLWTLNTPAMDFIGDNALALGKRHIHVCYELEDAVDSMHRTYDARAYLDSATFVHCEPNRADIFAALYNVKSRQFVLPNKPYGDPSKFDNNDVPVDVKHVLESFGKRFVFLYQGILADDRQGIVDVLKWICEEFPEDIVAVQTHISGLNIESLKCYRNFYLIPPLPAPLHLQVTRYASVGLAFYTSNRTNCSPLNALFCAPNKIYEYAAFGKPTLGNNVPGLRYTIGANRAGVCFEFCDREHVVSAVYALKECYGEFAKNAKKLYYSIDLRTITQEIVDFVRN